MNIFTSSTSSLRQLLHFSGRASSLTNASLPCFRFAKLAKPSESDDSKSKYASSKEFYEYLLRFSRPDERGYIKFKSLDLNQLVKVAHDAEDIQTIRTAYYNFLGHKVTFSSNQIDLYIVKAIELSCAPLTHEILANHNYLMYYPHTSVLNKLAEHYLKTSNVEAMTEFSKIFASTHFLKIDGTTLDLASSLGFTAGNNQILFNVANASYMKDIVDLTPATINSVLAGLARHLLSGAQKETSGNRVETKFLQHIKKVSQSYHTVIGKAYLAVAQKEIDAALVTLADLNLIDKTKLDASTKGVVLQNDALTVEFFDQLIASITTIGKQKYVDRLVKVLGDIQAKLGDNAIHQEIRNKVSSIVLKPAVAAATEAAEESTSEKPTEATAEAAAATSA